MNFRRYYIPGSAVFITQVVQDRKPIFHDPKNVNLLREILRKVKELHPFVMLGYVFLLDHFHMIIQHFTKEYKKLIGLESYQSMKLWQKRFWDHVIRDDRDLENHLHYMHFNPVKHGLVKDPRDWQNSSYIEWEERGLYPPLLNGMSQKISIGASRSRL